MVIHKELCKWLKFDMHKSESVLENETHNTLWDFEMQMYSSNRAQKTRPDFSSEKKKVACH